MARIMTILSPEKVSIEYSLAGFGSRMLSEIADILVWFSMLLFIYLIEFGIGLVIYGTRLKSNELMVSILAGIAILLALIVPLFYYITYEIKWNGQTPGKRLMKLRVIMDTGAPVSPSAVFKRALARFIDIMPILALPYSTAALSVFFNPRCQRLGDVIAGTVVVHENSARTIDLSNINPNNLLENSETSHPLSDFITTVEPVTLEDYRTIIIFLSRQNSLPKAIRFKMAWDLLEPFITVLRIQIPEGVTSIELLEAIADRYQKENGLLA